MVIVVEHIEDALAVGVVPATADKHPLPHHFPSPMSERMAVALIAGASAAFADEPPLRLVLACAAFDRDSGPWILFGCRALDNPNPQA